MATGPRLLARDAWYQPQAAGFILPQPDSVAYCGKFGGTLAQSIRDRSYNRNAATVFGAPAVSDYKVEFDAGVSGFRLPVNDEATGSFMVAFRCVDNGNNLANQAHVFGSGSGGGITFSQFSSTVMLFTNFYRIGVGSVTGGFISNSVSPYDTTAWQCFAGRWNPIVDGNDMQLRNLTTGSTATGNLPAGAERVLGPHSGFSVGTAQPGTAYGGRCQVSFLAIWNGVNLTTDEENELYARIKAEHADIYGVTI